MTLRWSALTAALLLGAAVATSLLAVVGSANPADVWQQLFEGSLASRSAFGETLLRFAPMVLVAAGLAPSLRIGLYNIGSPGQLGMGALAATLVALHVPGPGPWVIIVAALGAAGAGALWSLIAAEANVRWSANEIISTLALNFVAASVLGYLLSEPLQAERANIAQSELVPDGTQLPILVPATRAHIGVLVALGAAAVLVLFDRTGAGYRLRLFGENRRLALQSGVSRSSTIRATMAVAGAAAGLAGWMQVLGVDGRMYATVAEPVGYSGFFLALLAGLSGTAMLVVGLLLAAILRGAESLQIGVGLAPEIIDALVGLLLVAFVVRTRARELQAEAA